MVEYWRITEIIPVWNFAHCVVASPMLSWASILGESYPVLQQKLDRQAKCATEGLVENLEPYTSNAGTRAATPSCTFRMFTLSPWAMNWFIPNRRILIIPMAEASSDGCSPSTRYRNWISISPFPAMEFR